MKIKRGFTVAEVIITMAVAGVLAAILIPVLNRARPNQEMIMFKKAYYLTSRAVNELINDDDFYPDDRAGFADTNEAFYHGRRFEGASKFCELFATRMNVAGNVNCKSDGFDDGGTMRTTDQMIWSVPKNAFDVDGTQSIIIDVNGDRGDNCRPASVGNGNCRVPDRFEIEVSADGRLNVPEAIAGIYLASTNTTRSYQEIVNGH